MTTIQTTSKAVAPSPHRAAVIQRSLQRLARTVTAAAFIGMLASCGGGGGDGGSTPVPSSVAAPPPPPASATTTTTAASAGCGSAPAFTTGPQSLTSDGIARSYWVEMPASYDRNKAYPVIIGLHWRGGSADDVRGWSGFYGLKDAYSSNAIFIAPQGLDAGWANYGDRDIHFMRALISKVQQGACTDTQRVFATGFSFGGMMSNAIGCQMGDVVRAVVPMSGSLWSGCAQSTYRVAAMYLHAEDDNVVPYSAGEEARNTFTARNSCSAATKPIGSNGCVEYQDCSAGKPVVWCGRPTGGHWYPSYSASESKAFFDRFQ